MFIVLIVFFPVVNFRRKLVENDAYVRQLILYIHNNAVHHGFCNHVVEYPWTSYMLMLSEKDHWTDAKTALSYFNNREEFIGFHHQLSLHYTSNRRKTPNLHPTPNLQSFQNLEGFMVLDEGFNGGEGFKNLMFDE